MKNNSYYLDLEKKSVWHTPSITPLPQEVKNRVAKDILQTINPNPLTISLSDVVVDYGQLTATTPVLRTYTITVSTKNHGYVLKTVQDTSPTASSEAQIPSTTCDDGNCNAYTAGLWNNILAYGLGYHCTVNTHGCDSSFTNAQWYKQFASQSNGDTYTDVYQHLDIDKSSLIEITHKINTAATQSEEKYAQTIRFLAVPIY